MSELLYAVDRVEERPLLLRRQFWLTSILLWSFYGLIMASQLYFSMRHHGHHWWRILLWQMAGAATWMLLSPLVFTLKRGFPLDAARWTGAVGIHLGAAVVGSCLRLLPMTQVSLVLDPYRPVPTEATFWAEYWAQLSQWLPMDLLIYGAILVIAHAIDYREQVHRDQLRAAILETELVDAELRALKLELQPHFLFNTLNAVVALVRTGTNRRAEEMLLGLSELLRSTLDGRRQQLVPLSEEVEITELYLEIQRIRFGERLAFRWRIAPGTEGAVVPSLLLQPLIENAIRHAVERGSETGSIEVRSEHAGDRLILEIEDDGPRDEVPRRHGRKGHGLGLDNVRSRLEALFAEAWELDLEALPDRGTRVTLSFPWQTSSRRESKP